MADKSNVVRMRKLLIPASASVHAGPAADPAPAAAPAPAPSQPSASEIAAAVDNLNRNFAAFMDANNAAARQAQRSGSADVVTAEQVERINAQISENERTMRDLATRVAAASIAGAGTSADPALARHRDTFRAWMRGGATDGDLRGAMPQNVLQTQSDPDGGFLVPETVETTIERVLGVISAMRGACDVTQISTAVYKKPVNLGGASSGWVTERQSRSETTTPTLSELSFPTFEVYAMPAATQTFLDDASVDGEAWLGSEVAIAFAEKEAAAFISGDGVNAPKGFLSYTAAASYSWGKVGYKVSGVAAALTDGSNNGADALINLVHALKSGYRSEASFLMNDLTTSVVRKFKNSEGNYLWQPSIQVGQPSQLLGYPVLTDDNMPDVGAGNFPIAFAAWRRFYKIIDRIGIRVLRDPYTSKPYVLFYTTKRTGGGIQNFEAGKLLKVGTS